MSRTEQQASGIKRTDLQQHALGIPGREVVQNRVGYGDASQFSRDYKRLFGAPPIRGRSPQGLLRLAFPRSLPFDPRELRQLSVAADTQRTLI